MNPLRARAAGGPWIERLARAGILSRAVNYLVLAALVGAILVGRGDHEVDGRGAVDSLARGVLGHILLGLLCAGFAAYIAWQLSRALTTRSDQGTAGNLGRRAVALVTVGIYAGFLATTARVLLGSATSSPQASQESWTGRVLAQGGGRVAVAAAGCVVIGVGIGLAGYAAGRRFETPLDTAAMGATMRRLASVLGVAGQAARGVVMVIIGGFVVSAAVAEDASRSKGLDASLHTLANEPFGAAMLLAVALGFLAYGLYSLVDARYRDDFTR